MGPTQCTDEGTILRRRASSIGGPRWRTRRTIRGHGPGRRSRVLQGRGRGSRPDGRRGERRGRRAKRVGGPHRRMGNAKIESHQTAITGQEGPGPTDAVGSRDENARLAQGALRRTRAKGVAARWAEARGRGDADLVIISPETGERLGGGRAINNPLTERHRGRGRPARRCVNCAGCKPAGAPVSNQRG